MLRMLRALGLALAVLLLALVAVNALAPAASWAQAVSGGGGSSNSSVSVDVLGTVADAGTLLRADRDAFVNSIVLSNMQPDGGAGRYFLITNTDGCAKMGAGTSSEFCVSSNVATLNFSDVVIPTVHITQPACKTGATCLFYSDAWAPGAFPRGSLTTCGAGQLGGKATLSTDSREYFCNGSSAQRNAFSLDATASIDFGSMAADATDTQTMTLTGAATTDVVHCSPLADPGTGLDFRWFRVSAANTVTLAVRNASGGPLDPAALSIKCVVTR